MFVCSLLVNFPVTLIWGYVGIRLLKPRPIVLARSMKRRPLKTNPWRYPTKCGSVVVIWISSSTWNSPPKWIVVISNVEAFPKIVSAVLDKRHCISIEIAIVHLECSQHQRYIYQQIKSQVWQIYLQKNQRDSFRILKDQQSKSMYELNSRRIYYVFLIIFNNTFNDDV